MFLQAERLPGLPFIVEKYGEWAEPKGNKKKLRSGSSLRTSRGGLPEGGERQGGEVRRVWGKGLGQGPAQDLRDSGGGRGGRGLVQVGAVLQPQKSYFQRHRQRLGSPDTPWLLACIVCVRDSELCLGHMGPCCTQVMCPFAFLFSHLIQYRTSSSVAGHA